MHPVVRSYCVLFALASVATASEQAFHVHPLIGYYCMLLVVASVATTLEPECKADTLDSTKDCGCSSLSREKEAGTPMASRRADVPQTHDEADSIVRAQHNSEMVEIPPGVFGMGEVKDRVHFPHDGEGPFRRVRMSGFRIDRFEVSNAKFHDFVLATGYVTDAEMFGDSFVSELFISKDVSAQIDVSAAATPWWLPVKNATWRSPEGFDSALNGTASRYGERWQHPVVHVSWKDADAYCRWRNASLPTEAQWEYAARGGLQMKRYPWGDQKFGNETKDVKPRHRMNIWQGKFPNENTAKDGYLKTAPVDAFPAQNAFGLHNMVGNVWEWTSDWFSPVHFLNEEQQSTGYIDPTGPTMDELVYLADLGHVPKDNDGSFYKVMKGGSFMCHKSYCWRYRICARSRLTADSSAHHTGMRCVRPAADEAASHWSKAEVPSRADSEPSSASQPEK